MEAKIGLAVAQYVSCVSCLSDLGNNSLPALCTCSCRWDMRLRSILVIKLNIYEQVSGLQEEERERRMDYVPEESAVNTETIEVRALLDFYFKSISTAYLSLYSGN